MYIRLNRHVRRYCRLFQFFRINIYNNLIGILCKVVLVVGNCANVHARPQREQQITVLYNKAATACTFTARRTCVVRVIIRHQIAGVPCYCDRNLQFFNQFQQQII